MNLSINDNPAFKIAYDLDQKQYKFALYAGDFERAANAFAANWADRQIWEDFTQ